MMLEGGPSAFFPTLTSAPLIRTTPLTNVYESSECEVKANARLKKMEQISLDSDWLIIHQLANTPRFSTLPLLAAVFTEE